MNRGAVLATALLLAGGLPLAAASAQGLWEPQLTRPPQMLPPKPLPPAQHTDVPPLPQGATGFAYDPHTGQYVAEEGRAIWVAGHWQSTGDGGEPKWVEGQWMYPKPPAEGYGGEPRRRR